MAVQSQVKQELTKTLERRREGGRGRRERKKGERKRGVREGIFTCTTCY